MGNHSSNVGSVGFTLGLSGCDNIDGARAIAARTRIQATVKLSKVTRNVFAAHLAKRTDNAAPKETMIAFNKVDMGLG